MIDKENVIYDDKIISCLIGYLWPSSQTTLPISYNYKTLTNT